MTPREEDFEERAAIKQYDGGMTREQAEFEAAKEIRERWEGQVEAARKQSYASCLGQLWGIARED